VHALARRVRPRALEEEVLVLMALPPPHPSLGVQTTPAGPCLRVWSRHATALTACILDDRGRVVSRTPLTTGDHYVWSATVPGLVPGTRYAITADGPTGPAHRYDPSALLVDPYGRAVERIHPDPDDEPAGEDADGRAPHGRWCSVVVADEPFDWGAGTHPRRDLRDVVVYEAHVVGLTKLLPDVPEELRGTYAGLAHEATIAHLASLGVTAIELLPVHAFDTEPFLRERELDSYWGYSSVSFFAPHAAYASRAAREAGHEAIAREFKGMVKHLHLAGIEVYLDVVYNHTVEGGVDGDTSSLRGLDNASYYRHTHSGDYVDVTGCGNAIDTSHAATRHFVLDSLAHWANEFQVDGFRFDLAATLGRDNAHEFRGHHELLQAIAADERLEGVKIIAEPWDVGMGGWQTGNFADGWSEWNDQFRDRMRDFWVSDLAHSRAHGGHPTGIAPFTTAFAGSSNLFTDSRGPLASVNFVTAHDGFTLHDLVSYNRKHNLLNGELGNDGANDNHSFNFGVEGSVDDGRVDELRRARVSRDRRLVMRAMLGSLLLSAGVPMLTMGDEVARTQRGNNNAYNQSNELTWMSWEWTAEQRAQRDHVALLARLRREHVALRPRGYNHGQEIVAGTTRKTWFDALGRLMPEDAWGSPSTRTLQVLLEAIAADADEVGLPRARAVFPSGDGEVRDEAFLRDEAEAAAAAAAAELLWGDDPSPLREAPELDRVLVVVHGSEDDAVVRLPDTAGIRAYGLVWDSALDDLGSLSPADAGGDAVRRVRPGERLVVEGPSVRVYVPVG